MALSMWLTSRTLVEGDVAEDVAIEMHHAALVARFRQEIRDALEKASAGVRNDQLHAFEAAVDQMTQKCRPAGFVLLGALADPQDLAKPFRIDGRGHQQRNIANLAGPATLHHDPVEIEIRMLALDPPVPPGLDLGVDLLVQVRHRARADTGAPQRLRDVLDPADRNPRQIHLDQRFLDRALPPTIALDDRCLEGLAPQLGNLEVHFPGHGVQRTLVAAGPGILPALAAFVTPCTTKSIGFGIQQCVEGLFDRATHHLAEMVPDPSFINLDDLAHRLQSIVVTHGFDPSSVYGKPAILKVRKILYVILIIDP